MRGNHQPAPADAGLRGSIPACAGEPAQAVRIERQRQVYPRVCGGTRQPDEVSGGEKGLSPRVRGNPASGSRQAVSARSIPACAGEPWAAAAAGFAKVVYPRVCGGTLGLRCHLLGGMGLSPRVRGNPKPPTKPLPPARSIPACAGEPQAVVSLRVMSEVYPRVCGGTILVTLGPSSQNGLSPRVRGNPGHPQARNPGERSIPACAGEPADSHS